MLNIALTDAFWHMSPSGDQLAFHAAVGPHNAFFCLIMVALLVHRIASGTVCIAHREHQVLHDSGFTTACVGVVISLLAAFDACCQLIGWVVAFGELLTQ